MVDKQGLDVLFSGNCEQIPDGEYPHPTHCDRFILCFNQKMLLGICPKGNMFSMKTKQCVHPEKSDCKGEFILCFENKYYHSTIIVVTFTYIFHTLNVTIIMEQK